ncbi:SdiA-regulated domain-containing protein [Lewinella sp. IMCC34183]|uniref:SdiA-regulated domain-containing protein n=1 Tax=Lewinella sp. IMCC34183 TaxID=2248762 RepID=UPI000E24DAAC|nr:SdiA-regulated domain-containing protein [Lewinella sp. IMCC34183]
MNKLWEKPNLISVVILVVVLGIGVAYVAFTVRQRPETESFSTPGYFFPYNFDRLTRVVTLPEELEEISGLCRGVKAGEVFAIQDEAGELFVVNAFTGIPSSRVAFDKDRDYEGVARHASEVYVLEKDGDLHYFVYQEGEEEIPARKLETDFSYRNDTEGICYDSLTNTLLIVPKEQELNGGFDEEDTRRGVYSYDINDGRLNPQPTYYIDQLEVGRIVFGSNREYIVKPSGIAVDPFTHDLYILSSVGNVLVVIDRESNILHVELLEKKTFAQPEGITFAENGDLYISSEGRGNNGIIATLTRMQQPSPNEQ